MAPSNILDNASPDELRAHLDRQCFEMEGLRAWLEAQKIANRAVVLDLHEAALIEF